MRKAVSVGKKLLIVILIALSVTAIILSAIFFGIYNSAKLDKEKIVAERAQVKIYTLDGKECADDFNRYVKYENINSNIINAFVALEDKRFFKHKGVDYIRTAGALINDLKAGYLKEGGSTITQQLAKNTQLSNEKTIVRKIKELKLAREIEKYYKKEEILEMYLNAIYYGNGIYGIDSACKNYFGKSPSELNVAESALLAGIVKSPQNYSPTNYPDKAVGRMKLVLKLMREQGYISEKEYDDALNYTYVKPQTEEISPYFAAVIAEACEILGISEKKLIQSPYTIYTYFDEKAQETIKEISSDESYIVKTSNGNDAEFSITLADNESGGIIAYYSDGKTNPGTFRRQPGSTIKPLAVYAPAFERKIITPADIFRDEKTDFNGYVPSNYKDKYSGNVDVETALMNSINTVAVKVFNENDMDFSINMLKNMGISVDKSDHNLSLALGGMTYGVTFKELTEAYMCLASGGFHKKCGFIKRIVEDSDIIYNHNSRGSQIMGEDTAYLVTDILEKTAKSGTAKKLSSVPYAVAAKTGTVSAADGKNSDVWNVSYTTKNTLCVWFGGEDTSKGNSMEITGGGLPTLLAANIYRALKPPIKRQFDIPDSVTELEIDLYGREKDDIIYLANENTPSEYRKKYNFSVMNAPSRSSPYFVMEYPPRLEIEKDSRFIKLTFDIKYPYTYKLYRENLSYGFKDKIAEFTPENHISAENRAEYNDIIYLGNSIYDYSLEVCFEGRLVKRIYSDIIIIDGL